MTSPIALLNRARLFFRKIRRTRPFWAALWMMLGGFIIAYLPFTSLNKLVKTGIGGIGGEAIGVLLLIMGIFVLVAPAQRHVVSVIAAVLALTSFPVTNLGGFFFGMFFGLLGASMAFGWMPEKPARKYRWFKRIPQPESDVTSAPSTLDETSAVAEPNLMVLPAL